MKPIKRRILRQLKAKGISRQQFAEAHGISESYLSLLLDRKRRPSPQLAAKLESSTRIPFRELVGA